MKKSELADKVFNRINRAQSKVEIRRKTKPIEQLTPPPPPPPAPKGKRELATEAFLKGEGIEIGALHRPLIVPLELKVRYVDRLTVDELRKHYPELDGQPLVPVDIVDNGETLGSIDEGSQDFIVANHFFEHCQDSIKTLGTFLSKLRPGGVVYMAIPNKDYTFDIKRPITPYQHILDDHEHGPEKSKQAHFDEWTRLVAGIENEEQAAKHTAKLIEEDYSIHFHAWDQPALTALFFKLRRDRVLDYDIELMLRNGEEIIVVLRKPDPSRAV
jgi:predicted SAM-dependent methyltransferase